MDGFSLGQKLTTCKGRKILSGIKDVLLVLFWSLCNVLTIWHQLLKCHVGHYYCQWWRFLLKQCHYQTSET